jgi:small subunit ribosomal protein S13
MIRISGVNIDDRKKFRFGISIIKGIGPSNAVQIAKDLKFDPQIIISKLSEDQLTQIRNYITENFVVEGDLVREEKTNIKRQKDIASWRGLRHKAGLPVRGQTTKNNNRTVRGNKRITAGSGKAKAASKT